MSDTFAHFAENKETIRPVQDGVEIMKILCGIYESSEKGIEVTFS